MSVYLYVLLTGLIFIIPVAIPTWELFWISSGIISLPFIFLWGQHFYFILQPEHQYSTGSALGLSLAIIPTAALLLGMFCRYLLWVGRILIKQQRAK